MQGGIAIIQTLLCSFYEFFLSGATSLDGIAPHAKMVKAFCVLPELGEEVPLYGLLNYAHTGIAWHVVLDEKVEPTIICSTGNLYHVTGPTTQATQVQGKIPN